MYMLRGMQTRLSQLNKQAAKNEYDGSDKIEAKTIEVILQEHWTILIHTMVAFEQVNSYYIKESEWIRRDVRDINNKLSRMRLIFEDLPNWREESKMDYNSVIGLTIKDLLSITSMLNRLIDTIDSVRKDVNEPSKFS